MAFFASESVAFIGASENNDRFTSLYENLTAGERARDVYFLNPNCDAVFDGPRYDTIGGLSASVDLAVIVVPVRVVLTAFEECG